MHVLRMLDVCRRAKQLLPNIRTVAGGHHATLLPEDFFEPPVDFVVSGEGVGPFRRLLERLTAGAEARGIPGLWYRVGDGFVSGGNPEALDLDRMPNPARNLTAGDRHAYFIDWMRPIALLRTTVGCPYRCSFCSLWKIMDGNYFLRDIDRVVNEIASLDEEYVFFVDDEAFINAKRMTHLAQAIRAAGLKKRYFAYCRIDTLLRHRDVMALWREIGLERLFIGIEAASDEELNLYNKRIGVSQVEKGIRAAKEIGISIFGGFVVNTNYTAADFKRLERFIRHNKVDYPSFTILTPIPGTDALNTFDHITEKQPNGRPDWSLFDMQNVVTETQLPRQEFLRRYKNLYHVFIDKYSVYRENVRLRAPASLVVGNPVIAGSVSRN
jgi:radical SAM superfamily enzyme YgiQ (UPF0313 family)